MVFALEYFIEKSLYIFSMNKVQVQCIYELSWIKDLGKIVFNVAIVAFNHQINTFDDDIFGKIAAQESKQLVVIETVSLMVFELKNFDKIVYEAYSVQGWFVKWWKRLK